MSLTKSRFALLRLSRSRGLGPVTLGKLLALCDDDPVQAVERLPELCRQHKRQITLAAEADIQAEIDTLTKLGGQFLFIDDKAYPAALVQTPEAPMILTALGDLQWLQQAQVGIVGNRNASAAGLKFTRELVTELVGAGFGITSGLARGVDGAAHTAAMDAGGGTIAVVGGGIDVVYPPEHANLAQRIAEQGIILTEQPLGVTPTARAFPRRNRIIAGLSMGIVVTEAARKSGTLITAQYAGEYGRDVFAVPGSPAEPRAAGPNHLLKQGAIAVTEGADILNHISPNKGIAPQPARHYTREENSLFNSAPTAEDAAATTDEDLAVDVTGETSLIDYISTAPIGVDELIRQSGMAETAVVVELTSLELMGQITRTASGEIKRA